MHIFHTGALHWRVLCKEAETPTRLKSAQTDAAARPYTPLPASPPVENNTFAHGKQVEYNSDAASSSQSCKNTSFLLIWIMLGQTKVCLVQTYRQADI